MKKNEHQIFIVKLKPKDGILVEKCEMALNYRHTANLLEMPIVGSAAAPELGLENDGVVYFPPTCKSSTSAKSYEIVNLTAARVNYEWKIPYEAKELFRVDEARAYLEPFQRKVRVQFHFFLHFIRLAFTFSLLLRFFTSFSYFVTCFIHS